jgi:hypothetical protein
MRAAVMRKPLRYKGDTWRDKGKIGTGDVDRHPEPSNIDTLEQSVKHDISYSRMSTEGKVANEVYDAVLLTAGAVGISMVSKCQRLVKECQRLC